MDLIINGQRFISKPGYFALELKNVARDGENRALVTRLDEWGVEHSVTVTEYDDLSNVEEMLTPLRHPYISPETITQS